MIRVNLAKGRAKGGARLASNAAAGGGVGLSGIDDKEMAALRRVALTRLLVIMLGPMGLFVYEQQRIPELQTQVRTKQHELDLLSAKNAKALNAVQETKKFKKEQDVLQAQIDSIENLKKDRLREVKVLDFIQKDMPEKLWLSSMGLAEGKLSIKGMATSDSELTQFMDNLSRSAYLKEVSLIRSGDSNSPEYGAVKAFEISCLMEKTP